jgi:pilus assembly protein TadC
MAFNQFADRTDSAEVGAWAAIIRDVEELGIDVTRANRDQADAIRQSLRHRADARASSAGVKLVLPFLFCLMPAVAILLWGPAYLQLREFISTQSGDGGAFSTNLTDTIVNMQRDFDSTGDQTRRDGNPSPLGQSYRLNR